MNKEFEFYWNNIEPILNSDCKELYKDYKEDINKKIHEFYDKHKDKYEFDDLMNANCEDGLYDGSICCLNCYCCIDCILCEDCHKCDLCFNCKNGASLDYCIDCINSNYSTGLKNCVKCFNCADCYNMVKCKHCWDSNDLNNCKYYSENELLSEEDIEYCKESASSLEGLSELADLED